MNESFKKDEVVTSIKNIETAFADFATMLNDINEVVQLLVEHDTNSALKGPVGKNLIEMWNQNSSTFQDFHMNFEQWATTVNIIAANNDQFVVDTTALYRSNAGNLESTLNIISSDKTYDGTSTYEFKPGNAFPDGIPEYATCTDNFNMYAVGGKRYSWTDENGVWTTVFTDADGNVIAKCVSEGEFNEKFKVYEYSSERETIYDGNGNVISHDELLALQLKNQGNEATSGSGDAGEGGNLDEELDDPLDDEKKTSDDEKKTSDDLPVVQNVSSGQKVTIGDTEAYFVLRDDDGNRYFTLDSSDNAQIYVLGENGLETYTNGKGEIMSRADFVSTIDSTATSNANVPSQFAVSFNESFYDGTSPYSSVSNEIDASFTDGYDAKPGQAYYSNHGIEYVPTVEARVVSYDVEKLSPVTLDEIDRGKISLNEASRPDVIYLGPGQKIKYDGSIDFTFTGGDSGSYLVYDEKMNGYYMLDSNGTYASDDLSNGKFMTVDEVFGENSEFIK